MGTPEARRRAVAAHEARLQISGHRKVTFRASPEMLADIARLKERHGTLQAAIAFALKTAAR